MSKILKLSQFFLLASITTTFIKIPSFYQYYRIADLLLFISFIFIIIAIIKKQISFWEDKKLAKIILFIIGVNIFGSILGLLIYKTFPLQPVILNYARLASCLIIFFEIILLSQQDKTIFKKSLLCLMGSLVIIPIAYVFQSIGLVDYLMYDPSRFSGLLVDPNYFANFQIIPTLLLLFYIMRAGTQTKYKAILYIGFVFSVSIILWSGSRSGILGLLVSILILLFFFIRFSKLPKIKIAIIALSIIMALPLGFTFVPKYKQIYRQPNTETSQPQKSSGQINNFLLKIKNNEKVEQKSRVETFASVPNLVNGQDRLGIWKRSLYFILKNPFGYGPGYNSIINITGEGFNHRVVHNFELELLLQGGILLFIFFNYYFTKLLLEIYKSFYFKNFNEMHALIAIIIGILTSGLFLDSIPEKWVWIIIAFIIVYDRQINDNKMAV